MYNQDKPIKINLNLYIHDDEDNKKRVKIPVKFNKKNNVGGYQQESDSDDVDEIEIHELSEMSPKNKIDFIVNNSDLLKTIYKNYKNFNEKDKFLMNQLRKKMSSGLYLNDNIYDTSYNNKTSSGFDSDKYNKNKKKWNEKSINEFKDLFK